MPRWGVARVMFLVSAAGAGCPGPRRRPPGGDPAMIVVAQGRWGAGAAEFGRRGASESSPEGPSAIVGAGDGTVFVLDQVNRRVLRLSAGAAPAGTPIPDDTAQDLALASGGRDAPLAPRAREQGVPG